MSGAIQTKAGATPAYSLRALARIGFGAGQPFLQSRDLLGRDIRAGRLSRAGPRNHPGAGRGMGQAEHQQTPKPMTSGGPPGFQRLRHIRRAMVKPSGGGARPRAGAAETFPGPFGPWRHDHSSSSANRRECDGE